MSYLNGRQFWVGCINTRFGRYMIISAIAGMRESYLGGQTTGLSQMGYCAPLTVEDCCSTRSCSPVYPMSITVDNGNDDTLADLQRSDPLR